MLAKSLSPRCLILSNKAGNSLKKGQSKRCLEKAKDRWVGKRVQQLSLLMPCARQETQFKALVSFCQLFCDLSFHKGFPSFLFLSPCVFCILLSQNVTVPIANIQNYKVYLSKSQNVFVQITKCIWTNHKM